MVLLAIVVAGACASASSAKPGPSGGTAPASQSLSSGPCAVAQDQPAAPDGVSSAQPLWVLAGGLAQPDDLYFDRDGSLLVGEYSAGRIARIGGEAGLVRLPAAVGEPEGITRIGETLYVADQSRDRVVAIDGAGSLTTFLQLTPVSGLLGLDQIAAQGNTLIVPDSPHGTVLFVDAQGQVTRRAGGFARPTGAWPLADGSVLISDENASAVYDLMPDGTRTKLASLAVADDAVRVADGRTFAISEENGQLIETGSGPMVTGLKTAQGLTEDAAGNLLVTENAAGRIDAVILTFKLLPASAAVAVAANQPICIRVARAPGFTAGVQLQSGQGYRVSRQPSGDQPGEILPDLCRRPPCSIRVVAQSGQLTDGVWLQFRNS